MRRLLFAAVAGTAVVAAVAISCATTPVVVAPEPAIGVKVPAGAPLPMLQDIDPEDLDPARDVPGMPPVALAPPGGAVVQTNGIRIPRPNVIGPRRVGIQVGHWKTDEVPAELGTRIIQQTGTSWAGVKEVDVNMDIAKRVSAALTARGYAVDILATTIPVGYLADVFLALHADGDGTGENSGFKMAHGSRRGPYEDKLVSLIRDEYAKATNLAWDGLHVTRNMSAYFCFNWGRYQHAAAPHTPAAILEMGYLSNDADRELLTEHPDIVASAIVAGIQRFLDDVPRTKIFGEDLIVPPQPIRPTLPPPSPSPAG
jgi:N-acetylmuramoyl-L-alanine amidase